MGTRRHTTESRSSNGRRTRGLLASRHVVIDQPADTRAAGDLCAVASAFVEGTALAREISDWCGGGATDIRAAGMGIPVFCRSAPWDNLYREQLPHCLVEILDEEL